MSCWELMPMPTENLTHATHSNDLGDCSESKATKAAHDNPSPITGYDTVWRGKGENPHKFTGENVGNPTNGTHVNGELLQYREKRMLQKGDIISLAGECYSFH